MYCYCSAEISSEMEVATRYKLLTLLFTVNTEGRFPEKNCCSFGFCSNEGGRALPNFLSHFQEVHFLSVKEPISSK